MSTGFPPRCQARPRGYGGEPGGPGLCPHRRVLTRRGPHGRAILNSQQTPPASLPFLTKRRNTGLDRTGVWESLKRDPLIRTTCHPACPSSAPLSLAAEAVRQGWSRLTREVGPGLIRFLQSFRACNERVSPPFSASEPAAEKAHVLGYPLLASPPNVGGEYCHSCLQLQPITLLGLPGILLG